MEDSRLVTCTISASLTSTDKERERKKNISLISSRNKALLHVHARSRQVELVEKLYRWRMGDAESSHLIGTLCFIFRVTPIRLRAY